MTESVARASRVCAFYFLVQTWIAGMLAWRKQSWGAIVDFTAVGLAMATITIFGISI